MKPQCSESLIPEASMTMQVQCLFDEDSPRHRSRAESYLKLMRLTNDTNQPAHVRLDRLQHESAEPGDPLDRGASS